MKKSLLRLEAALLLSSLFFCPLGGLPAHAEEEELPPQEPVVATEDEVLKEQIAQVHQGLLEIHQAMAKRRRTLMAETNEVRKANLYAEIDGLRKEYNLLQDLLFELVDEATATEWTKIDEALKRVRRFERYQERAYQKEENLRERQQ
ncbi:MAG: hypothetical protein HYS41_00990 [Candidatus Omnitrophica bacterium]|nr:hypothetical protein [Candidatus Omnitrophota bacterium]